MARRFVLAVDPGETCGYAAAVVDLDSLQLPIPCAIVGESSVREFLRLARELVREFPSEAVVVAESFRLIPGRARKLSGQRVHASEALGAIREWCAQRNVPLVEQPPVVTKTVKRSLLEMFGLWERTKERTHARDAARHLVAYILKEGGCGKCSVKPSTT